MVHGSFQTPQNVGDVEVVENVRVDVTKLLLNGRQKLDIFSHTCGTELARFGPLPKIVFIVKVHLACDL